MLRKRHKRIGRSVTGRCEGRDEENDVWGWKKTVAAPKNCFEGHKSFE